MFPFEAGEKAPANLDHSVDKGRVNSIGKKKREKYKAKVGSEFCTGSCAALGAQLNDRELYFAPGK